MAEKNKGGRPKKNEEDKAKGKRINLYVSYDELDINKWLDTQKNKNWALKVLIRREIETNGYKDLTYTPAAPIVVEEPIKIIEKVVKPEPVIYKEPEEKIEIPKEESKPKKNVPNCYGDDEVDV